MNGLQNLNNAIRWATIQFIDIQDDQIDRVRGYLRDFPIILFTELRNLLCNEL